MSNSGRKIKTMFDFENVTITGGSQISGTNIPLEGGDNVKLTVAFAATGKLSYSTNGGTTKYLLNADTALEAGSAYDFDYLVKSTGTFGLYYSATTTMTVGIGNLYLSG